MWIKYLFFLAARSNTNNCLDTLEQNCDDSCKFRCSLLHMGYSHILAADDKECLNQLRQRQAKKIKNNSFLNIYIWTTFNNIQECLNKFLYQNWSIASEIAVYGWIPIGMRGGAKYDQSVVHTVEKTTIQKIIPNFLRRIGKYVNQFAIDYLGLKQHCIPTYRYNK